VNLRTERAILDLHIMVTELLLRLWPIARDHQSTVDHGDAKIGLTQSGDLDLDDNGIVRLVDVRRRTPLSATLCGIIVTRTGHPAFLHSNSPVYP